MVEKPETYSKISDNGSETLCVQFAGYGFSTFKFVNKLHL